MTLPNLLFPKLNAPLATHVAIAIPRIACGIILPVKFGLSKFPVPQWFIDDIGRLGFPMPTAFAWAAVLSETAASFMLALGLLTRPAALLIIITMFVAAFVQKADAPLWERLPSLFFLLNAYFAFVLGSGTFGVDELLRRRVARGVAMLSQRS